MAHPHALRLLLLLELLGRPGEHRLLAAQVAAQPGVVSEPTRVRSQRRHRPGVAPQHWLPACGALAQLPDGALEAQHLRFGRIVASDIEVPNVFVNMV